MIDLDAQKKIAEISKLKTETYKTLCGLLVGAASTVGVIAIFIYCFFFAHFFPTGLKVGDSLFFIFTTLGLSLTGLVLSGSGMMAYVPWVSRQRTRPSISPPPVGGGAAAPGRKDKATTQLLLLILVIWTLSLSIRSLAFVWFGLANPIPLWMQIALYCVCIVAPGLYVWISYELTRKAGEVVMSVMPGLMFALATGIVCIFLPDFLTSFVLVGGLLLGGLFISQGIDRLDLPPPETPEELEHALRARKTAIVFVLMGTAIPYIACGINAKIFNYVMTNLGVYTEHATLVVNKSELRKLQTVADSKGVRLYACGIDDESAAISDVRIWWHGIGERSYVELDPNAVDPAANRPLKTGIRVELDSSGVRKSESLVNRSCIELRRGIYFDSNRSELTPEQWELSQPIVEEFFKAKKGDDSIVLVGYADPRPSITNSNFKLAHDRACNVYRHLQTEQVKPDQNVLIDIRGDMEAASTCSAKDGAAREQACEERNRRVELRLIGAAGNNVVRAATANAKDVCK
jgi:outer membrane protein OmpA-like peptidoglycan-associated protein